MSFTADEIWVSDYFKNELAKVAANDGGNDANLQATTVKLVTDIGAAQTKIDGGFTGTFNLEFDSGNTGRAKLENDLTFTVEGVTVGGWVASNATQDLFGANFAVQEVYAGAGEFKLLKDVTHINFAKKV